MKDLKHELKILKSKRDNIYNSVKFISKFHPKHLLIPDVILEIISKWEITYKSPHSMSIYSSSNIGWNNKPDAVYCVSDHWNFIIDEKKHKITNIDVINNSYITLCKYNKNENVWEVMVSLPSNFEKFNFYYGSIKKLNFLRNLISIIQKENYEKHKKEKL